MGSGEWGWGGGGENSFKVTLRERLTLLSYKDNYGLVGEHIRVL